MWYFNASRIICFRACYTHQPPLPLPPEWKNAFGCVLLLTTHQPPLPPEWKNVFGCVLLLTSKFTEPTINFQFVVGK